MKKLSKRLLTSSLALTLLLVLSGCVRTVKDANGDLQPTGTVWNLIGKPMSALITFFAENMSLGFGMGIILTTIVVRLILLPLGLSQAQKAAQQTEKMAYLKDIFEPINERMRNATTQEEKLAAQQDLMMAQRQNGINMLGGIGCLPLLIQLPFFSALYFAARYTPGISGSKFLWLELDQSNLILTLIIGALYLFQTWLMMQSMPVEQRENPQSRSMMYMTPIMMVFMSLSMPSGVALYWFVGGIFAIIQQLLTTYLVKPKVRQQIAEEYKNNPPKAFKTSNGRKDVTPSQTSQTISAPKKTNRNAGKQRSR